MLLETFILLFGIYWSTSILFLLHPTLIHKKKKFNKLYQYAYDHNKVVHVSHRGGSRENLENTIQSFSHAKNMKTNELEMDLCLTKDKKVVVIHDSNLKRMTGLQRHVHEYNYEDLPKMKDIVTIDFTVHKPMDTTKCTHRYFPLFEDILKQFPDVNINIEVKTPTEEFGNILNNLIKKYNREDTITWGARPPQQSELLYQINPKMKRFFNEISLPSCLGLFFVGLLPFVPLSEDSFQAPQYVCETKEWKMRETKTLKQRISVHVTFIFIKLLTMVGKILFAHLKKRGIVVSVWVLNFPSEFDTAIENGVMGIMSDSPTALKKYLIEKNKWIDNEDLKQQ